MKAEAYIKKVKESQAFKEFMKEDPKAYLCSLFFTRDFSEKRSETQVDFYSPKIKMIVSFKVGKKVERTPLGKKAETLTHKKFVPKPLKETIKMDVDQIEKILVFVNITDGEIIWNCTAFLKGLGLLMAHVEDKSGTVLFMEKKSFFDLLRFTKGGAGQATGGQIKKDDVSKKDFVKKEGK